ncbi:hypothetical protein [Pseudonocardia spirodelae]|uniref:Uncharacterized protein n=1 Tax=Pseudonocardia spirodelae TaxID=3133431 RepID=A0ABU8T1R9_9PSEU
MTTKKIDAEFVTEWAAAYPSTADDHVLGPIHRAVGERGYFTFSEAEEVIKWKSNRTITILRRNDPADVETITEMALRAPEHLAHRVLGLLRGVGVPVASAFLTIAKPDTFTVIDVLAMRTLRRHGEQDSTWPAYADYLKTCRGIARRCGTDLRTLDRALWAWGKAHPA